MQGEGERLQDRVRQRHRRTVERDVRPERGGLERCELGAHQLTDHGRLRERTGQQAVHAPQRRQPAEQARGERVDRAARRHGAPGDRVDDRQQVARAVLQLGRKLALPPLGALACRDIALDGQPRGDGAGGVPDRRDQPVDDVGAAILPVVDPFAVEGAARRQLLADPAQLACVRVRSLQQPRRASDDLGRGVAGHRGEGRVGVADYRTWFIELGRRDDHGVADGLDRGPEQRPVVRSREVRCQNAVFGLVVRHRSIPSLHWTKGGRRRSSGAGLSCGQVDGAPRPMPAKPGHRAASPRSAGRP